MFGIHSPVREHVSVCAAVRLLAALEESLPPHQRRVHAHVEEEPRGFGVPGAGWPLVDVLSLPIQHHHTPYQHTQCTPTCGRLLRTFDLEFPCAPGFCFQSGMVFKLHHPQRVKIKLVGSLPPQRVADSIQVSGYSMSLPQSRVKQASGLFAWNWNSSCLCHSFSNFRNRFRSALIVVCGVEFVCSSSTVGVSGDPSGDDLG